jgi:phage-related protein
MEWEIEFYKTESGRCPVQEFIDSLSKKARAKVFRDIDLLEEFGLELRAPFVRNITGVPKLKELRTKFGADNYRIFYFAFTGRKFILLHGFIKKTRQTPQREIQIAVNRMNDYTARHKGGVNNEL